MAASEDYFQYQLIYQFSSQVIASSFSLLKKKSLHRFPETKIKSLNNFFCPTNSPEPPEFLIHSHKWQRKAENVILHFNETSKYLVISFLWIQ